MIDRLIEHDRSQTPSPFARELSTSAVSNAKAKNIKSTKDQDKVHKVGSPSDVEVHSIKGQEVDTQDVKPAIAPGLPEAKVELDAPPTLEIEMPDVAEEVKIKIATPVSHDPLPLVRFLI